MLCLEYNLQIIIFLSFDIIVFCSLLLFVCLLVSFGILLIILLYFLVKCFV